MASTATARFFEGLASRGHVPAVRKTTGTIRFDLTNGRTARFIVAIEKGDVTVTRGNGDAECVVRTPRALFDEIVRGRANALAAVLRGAITFEGDGALLLAFQRVLPSSADRSR